MNGNTITKIVLYVVLIIILLSIMIFGLFKGDFTFNLGDYDKVELYNETYNLEDVDKLNVNIVATDITIKDSEDGNIRVVIKGKENRKDRYSISNDNKNLKIEEKAYSSFCFGFCFYNEEVIVYLPNSFNKDINIKGTSSDVNVMNSYDSKMDIHTVSGEIKLQDANDIVARTTSGDIEINDALDVEVKTTSGEVTIRSGKKVKVETTSGDISVDKAEKLEINSTSGEVRIGKTGNVNISTISGDVTVDDLNVNGESYIGTTSGEVLVSKVNDVYVETNSTSGDSNIGSSNRNSSNTLKIKTTSGDIVVR